MPTNQGSNLCCKRKKQKSSERKPCVCGCRYQTTNFFKQGHDETLRSHIKSGSDKLDDVLWGSVPLCFQSDKENGCNGDYVAEIREHRRRTNRTDTSEIQPIGRTRCRFDKGKNPK